MPGSPSAGSIRLSLLCPQPLPLGMPLRVIALQFDAVAVVVANRASGAMHSVHAQLLTLQLLKSGRGVYVDVRA